MAVKIRLRRVGAKKQPAYRIVVADARAPRDGRFIESIGHYNPLTDPATVVIDGERALYWLRNGAQPTDVVRDMLVKQGVWSQFSGEPMPEVPTAPVAVEAEAAPVAEEAAPAAEETEAPAPEPEPPAAEEGGEGTPETE